MDLSVVKTLAAHWTGRTKEVPVPKTWKEAHFTFWLHPTPMVAVTILCCLMLYRAGVPLSPVVDAVMVAVGVALWTCQEWCASLG